MANKQIIDYDAKTGLARDDYFLEQDNAGGLYTKTTPAQILGLLQISDLPNGVLKTPTAISGTLQVVGDGTTDTPLKLSSNNLEVRVSDAAFQEINFLNEDADGTLALIVAAGSDSTPINNAYFGLKAYGETHPSWADYCDVLAVNSAKMRFRAVGCDVEFADNTTTNVIFRSNGRVNLSRLPTSSSGLSSGDLWNDSGTVKIV
jgi:hypothetical protein